MYFLDTCIMIGYFENDPKYVNIVESGKPFFVTKFQLMELYYISLREHNEEQAEKYYEVFAHYEVVVPEKTLKNAMKKRLELYGKKVTGKAFNVSYVDAIGYQYALENNLKFVTCDPAFEKLSGVEYLPEK
ncbi:PIN domain-containing protein [Candidatus Micrarchaeota archaeon]|nr:PIN domain-containing protein [Candidatus Micrarchaeota archaeon]